jgi:calcineurin-like phosphoesterase
MQSKLPTRFSVADGPCQLDAVLFTLSDDTGRTVDVKRINIAD